MNPADADYQEQLREFARHLFTNPDSPDRASASAETDEKPTQSNVVPDEGKTPPAPPRDQMRDFTRDLFGYDD